MFLFPSLFRLHNQLSNDRRSDSKNKHLNLQVIQRRKKKQRAFKGNTNKSVEFINNFAVGIFNDLQ